MAYDYDQLLNAGTDYGLEAFMRAVTKAAYDQGYSDGVGAVEEFAAAFEQLRETIKSMRQVSLGTDAAHHQQPESQRLLASVAVATPMRVPAAFANSAGPAERGAALTAQTDLALTNDQSSEYGRSEVGRLYRPRVRRGLVPQTVTIALELEPGRSIKEYEELVLQLEPEISAKSVGNELRRGEIDGRYKRDRPGGYRWYLADADVEAADRLSDEAAASHSNQGGRDEAPDNMT